MKIKPMLGEFELDGIEYIESAESRALVEHRVPGLAGNYFQDMGTVPNAIVIAGSKSGDEERDNFLTGVREILRESASRRSKSTEPTGSSRVISCSSRRS